MSTDQTLIKLSGLRDDQLRRLLIAFIREMTLVGRGSYRVGEGVEAPGKLREVNETVHRASDALRHLEDGHRAVAMEMLAAQLEEPELTGAAFDRAMKQLDVAAPADVHTGV